MLMLVGWGLMGIIIFMVGGIYGKLDQIARSIAALHEALPTAPAADVVAPAPPPVEG